VYRRSASLGIVKYQEENAAADALREAGESWGGVFHNGGAL
jgi:hypothetical protein